MIGTRNLKMRVAICSVLLALVGTATGVTTINVPGEYGTIQAAIDAADAGDEIEVAPGTYNEAINFKGKAIKLYSSGGPAVTTIHGVGAGSRVVLCNTYEGGDTILEGFTITGGDCGAGGGMANLGTSPTVTNCIFTENSADYGGGMWNYGASPKVTNCTFSSNTSTNRGSGMYNEYNSNPTVTNCTFTSNTGACGMWNRLDCSPTVTNCIFWGNSPWQIYNVEGSTAYVTYSDVQGGWPGTGNIDLDPLFADADGRLLAGSPCIDAGDNGAVAVATDLDGNPRIADGDLDGVAVVDMGAYEKQTTLYVPAEYGTIQAAINAAMSGYEIEVAPGAYYEAINFNGKAIRLYSIGGPAVTTIDATGLVSSVVTCNSGEGATTIMEGFTITGGNGVRGGGMYNFNSSPTVTNCIFISNTSVGGGGGMSNYSTVGVINPTVTNCNFIDNKAGDGGGMMNVGGSSPTVTNCNFIGNTGYTGGGMNNYSSNSIVTNCTFISNTCGGRGGGMMNIRSSNPTVTNCKFSKNWVVYTGGGMSNEENCNPIVTNCTFSDNTAGYGGGMHNQASNPTVTNCILWGDTPNEIVDTQSAAPIVTYSDVQGGSTGTGNIDADPMFADALNGDYRLLSGSPCIDVGNNAAVPSGVTTDLDGNPRIIDGDGNGTAIVDVGAYEFHAKTGIKGTVVEVDSAGEVSGPLAGATVTLVGQETATTETDSTGNFSFLNISAGNYTVTITKSDYYDVSSDIYIEENEVLHEVFQLAAYMSGPPVGYDFVSPGGKHFIDGTPGNIISFEITVAWNGSPGGVNFWIGNDYYPATVIELEEGFARASLTIPAPLIVNNFSKLTIEVVNGEGKHTYLNTDVRFHPVPGIISSWYKDKIPWMPSGLSLSYSDGMSWSWELPIEDPVSLEASLGYNRELSYDLKSGSFSGLLEGTGGLSWSWPVAGVRLLGEAQAGLGGTLDVGLGDGPPVITPGWQVSFTGRLGVEAPVVLVVNVIFPPAAPAINTLLETPVVKDIVGAFKVRLYIEAGASIAGIYEGGEFGDCFLGSTEIDVSGTIGVEIQAAISLWGAEVSVYAGGGGTPSFQICPDFKLNSITIHAYVGVRATVPCLFWTCTVVDKRFGCTIPIGGTEGTQALSAQLLGNASEADVTCQLASDSLNRWGPANRPVGSAITELAFTPKAGATGSEAETIAENVIKTASPSVVSDASQTMLLFSLHDVSKPDPIASDIGTFVSTEGGAWSPGRITDDDASDFVAKVTSVGSDSYLAAWERISGDVSGVTDPGQIDQIYPHLEIAASWFDRGTGVWSALTEITSNDFVDRSPLPIVFGSTRGIVWMQNDVDYIGNSENGDRLMFSEWTGSQWDTQQLWSGPCGILSISFASDIDGQGHIVFAVDLDGNTDTRTDRELYGISTSDGTWEAAERLTTNDVEDSCPVIVNPNGTAIVVWNSNDTLLYAPLGDDWSPKQVYSQYTLNNQAATLAGITMADGAAIAYTVQGPSGMDIMASFYDANLDRWSLPRQLTFDEDAESAISVAFDGDRLIVAYLKTKTERKDVDVEIDGQIYHIENVPEPGRTDLCILHHKLGYDLSVDSSSIVLEPANPEPGLPATIRATVANSGDLGAENIAVEFYDGDPESGGSIIGIPQIISGNLIPGGENEVSVSWDVPADSSNSHEIFAVVDPSLAVDDRDRSNNTASKFAVLPDVGVKNSWSTELSPDSVMLIARIANTGVTAAKRVTVSWRVGSREGTEIGSDLIGTLARDGFYEASFVWDVDGVFDSDDYVKVFGVVSSASGVPDFDERNNAFSLLVNDPSPEVQDTTPPQIFIYPPEPYGLYPVGVALDFSAYDSGSGLADLLATLTDAAGDPQEVDSGFVPDAGVYNLVVSARDEAGNEAQSEVFFVVYDPEGGFVTGGGWIDSPAGAYKPDESLTGKANFGFVSKYKKGATVPTGNTEFVFKAGDLNFHSSSYQWLVVTGSNYARFKGTGTINGSGEYKFMLWAGDNEPDTFRIRIWTEDDGGVETVVYDNGSDQPIGGGSIVIHTGKK